MYTEEQIREMEDIMLHYLTQDLPDIGFVVINYETQEEGIEEDTAFTDYLGKHMGIKYFQISFHPALLEYPNEFKRMIAHELIHVMQVLRGDKFDFSLPYAEQPHEIEAYNREDEVVAVYEKVMAFKEWRKELNL